MKILLLTIGKPKLAFARAGIDEYLGRLRGTVEWTDLKGGTREEEGARLIAASEDHFRIVLDETGNSVTSRTLAEKWAGWENRAISRAALMPRASATMAPFWSRRVRFW